MWSLIIGIVVLAVFALLFKRKKSAMTLPGPPGVFYLGNLLQVGEDQSLTYEKWAKKYGPVFQVHLGNIPVVVVNSAEAAEKLFIEQGAAYVSRPVLYTFSRVSSTAGFTIGTSPWDDSCKTKRKAAASGLNQGAVQRYIPIIEEEVRELIKDLYNFGDRGNTAIVPMKFLQRFALNVSLVVNYGTRMRAISDELFKEIIEIEAEVSNFRSVAGSFQDFLPILRILPVSQRQKKAIEVRNRRDVYMSKLLKGLEDEISKGEDRPCITGTILKNPHKLSPMELSSICLSMVSAGLDTLASTMYWSMGYLAQHPEIQQKAYNSIREIYGDKLLDISEERVEYISALHKESLRFFSVLKLGLPRKTIKASVYENHVIPADTTVFYNVFAINRDEKKYTNAEEFNPDRYLNNPDYDNELAHYSFGIGRRMCLGNLLASKEMYIAYGEIIEHFKIELSTIESEKNFDTNPRTATENPKSLAHVPKPYKIRFVPRNPEKLEAWLQSPIAT